MQAQKGLCGEGQHEEGAGEDNQQQAEPRYSGQV
jgi:hypothetical protein